MMKLDHVLSLSLFDSICGEILYLLLQVLGSISLAERTFEPPAVAANAARAAAGKAEAERKKAQRAAQVQQPDPGPVHA